MSGRPESFIQDLTQKKALSEGALLGYSKVVGEFEEALGLDGVRPFGQSEINQFLAFRQKAGDTEQALRNYGVVCQAYLVWCHNRRLGGVLPPTRPAPVVAATNVPAAPAEAGAPSGALGAAGMTPVSLDGLPPPPSKPGVPATGTPTLSPPGAPAAPTSPNAPAPAFPVEQRWLTNRYFLAGLLAVTGTITGCVADSIKQAKRITAFGAALRREARQTVGMDKEGLSARVQQRIEEYRIVKPEVLTHINFLSPQNINNLMPSERMVVAEAMQAQHQRTVSAVRGERVREPEPIYYVEVSVRGAMPGVFGSKKFELTNSVAVGGGIDIVTREGE